MNVPRGQQHRYPGARSFEDAELDRKLFFGRDRESAMILHVVLSEPLVVLYAKSGTGKSSLLNAGLKEPLRERGFVPLSARLNCTEKRPWDGVFDFLLESAQSQGLEVIGGDRSSAWNFFSTLELWREDRLLTPVLILDQFEELFTFHAQPTREAFADELAAVVRGLAPRGEETGNISMQDAVRLPLRIVISIREDFLGNLEELATAIPHILHTRMRLAPLSLQSAADAIQRPAEVADPQLLTAPFEYTPETTHHILQFLTRGARSKSLDAPAVEPFQLQLVCYYIEQLITAKGQLSRGSAAPDSSLRVDYELDLGGDAGMRRIVARFYDEQVAAIRAQYPDQNIIALCEQGLISRGRRLSLEEGEIEARFGIRKDVLIAMVDKRLLRAEPRLGSNYYELSHDTLIDPIAESRARAAGARRRRRQVALAGLFVCLGMLVAVLLMSKWRADEIQRLVEAASGEMAVASPNSVMLALQAAGKFSPDEEPSAAVTGVLFDAVTQPMRTEVDLARHGTDSMFLSPTGQLVALAEEHGRVVLLDRAGDEFGTLQTGLAAKPHLVVFGDAGDRLLVAGGVTVQLWDIVGRKSGSAELPAPPTQLALHPSLPMAIAALGDGSLVQIRFDADPGSSPRLLRASGPDRMLSVKFDRHGTHVAFLTSAGFAYLAALVESAEPLVAEKISVPSEFGPVASAGSFLAASDEDEVIVAAVDGRQPDLSIRYLEGATPESASQAAASRPVASRVSLLAITPDGQMLTIVTKDNRARTYQRDASANQWRRLAEFRPFPASDVAVREVAWGWQARPAGRADSSQARALLAFRSESRVVVTDAMGSSVVTIVPRELGSLSAMAFLGEKYLAIGGARKDVALWSVPSPADAKRAAIPDSSRPVGVLSREYARTSYIERLVASERGDQLVVVDDESRVEFWHWDGAEPLPALRALTCHQWRAISSIGARGQVALSTELGAVVVSPPRQPTKNLAALLPKGENCSEQQAQAARVTRENAIATMPLDLSRVDVMALGLTDSTAAALTRDGRILEAAARNKAARRVRSLSFEVPKVTALAFAAHSREFALGRSDGIWHNGSYGASEYRLNGGVVAHDGAIQSMAFSEEGSSLLTAGTDGRVRFHRLDADDDSVPFETVAIRPISEVVPTEGGAALIRSAGKLILHDPGSLRASAHPRLLSGTIAAVDPHRRYFITLEDSGRTAVREFSSGHELIAVSSIDTCVPSALAAAPDGELLWIGCANGGVLLTDLQFWVVRRMHSESGAAVSSLSVHKSGQSVAAGHQDGMVSVWNSNGEPIAKPWRAHEGEIGAIALLSETGDVPEVTTASSSDQPGTVKRWKHAGGEYLAQASLESERLRPGPIAWLEDIGGGRVLVIDSNASQDEFGVAVWDVRQPKLLHAFHQAAPIVDAMLVEADINRLFTVDASACLRRWSWSEEPASRSSDVVVRLSPVCSVDSKKSKDTQAGPGVGGRFSAGATSIVLNEQGRFSTWSLERTEWLDQACQRIQSVSTSGTDRLLHDKARDECAKRGRGSNEALLWAARVGDLAGLRRAIKGGADLGVSGADGRTALAIAAAHAHAEIVMTLLAQGADPTTKDRLGASILHHAAWGGEPTIVSALIASGLSARAADAHGVTPAMVAASRGTLHLLPGFHATPEQLNRAARSGITSLMVAAIKGHRDDVDWLLDHGADKHAIVRSSAGTPRWHNVATLTRDFAPEEAEQEILRLLQEGGRGPLTDQPSFVPRVWLAPPYVNGWSEQIDQLLLWQRGQLSAPEAPARVLEELEGGAARGDPDALFLLGLAATIGFGERQSDAHAIDLIERAARLGHTHAHAVSFMFGLAGHDPRRSIRDTAVALEKAIEAGGAFANDPLALYLLAICYDDGVGGRETEKTRELLQRAQSTNHPFVLNSLYLASSDDGDDPKLMEQLRDAAMKSGDPIALNSYGAWIAERNNPHGVRALEDAWEVRLPTRTLFLWEERTPKKASALPAKNLSIWYLAPTLTAADGHKRAVEWTEHAATKGECSSEVSLAWRYEHGVGVPKDFVRAVEWYRRSIPHGCYFSLLHLESLGVSP